MTNIAATPVENANDMRHADLLKEIRQFGRDSAEGRDALPKLAMRVVLAAAEGVIDADEADDLYKEYVEAETKKAMHERSSNGVKANTSKLRKLIELGSLTYVDGVEIVERAVEVRRTLEEGGAVKVKAVYPALVDVARAQANVDRALTDEELWEAVAKPSPKDKSVKDEVVRAQKILDNLITGEKGLQCQDAEIVEAYHKLDAWITTLVQREKARETIEELREAGIPVPEELIARSMTEEERAASRAAAEGLEQQAA